MSRVGKKPILIPAGVEVKIEGDKVFVKGPKGELQREVRPEIKIETKEGKIFLSEEKENKKSKALWGLTRMLIFNMVKGVVDGYEKKLQIEGIGYKANMEGGNLVLQVGFSHPVKVKKPEGINFSAEKNIITISGINKELVGQTAAKIRAIRPTEPYKGMGLKYVGEIVRRKEGKKVVTAGGA